VSIRFSVLASGSKGNSIYIASEKVRLLIDAGLSAREIERRLLSIGVSPRELDGVVLTHEHIDHARGAGSLSRRHRLPVYLNERTHANLPASVGRLEEREEFVPGRTYYIGDISIHPFAISHDAADPVGFTLVNGSVKVGVCTDLGTATRLVHRHLEQCSVLILEANHDVEMLNNGPYPWSVKQRIRSRMGHLSNEQSVEVVSRVFNNNLRQVVLAHLSETNNRAEVARDTFNRLLDRDMRAQLRINVALQHMPMQLVELI